MTDLPLCECGCGRPVKLASRTRAERGWIKGEPLRFATQSCAARVNRQFGGHEGGENHPSWKGNDITYFSLHEWLRMNYPQKLICSFCGARGKTHYALVGAEYTRDIEDYVELCPSCHFRMDNLIRRILKGVSDGLILSNLW